MVVYVPFTPLRKRRCHPPGKSPPAEFLILFHEVIVRENFPVGQVKFFNIGRDREVLGSLAVDDAAGLCQTGGEGVVVVLRDIGIVGDDAADQPALDRRRAQGTEVRRDLAVRGVSVMG